MSNAESLTNKRRNFGSLTGLLISIIIGFVIYFLMTLSKGTVSGLAYKNIINGILGSPSKQVAWFFMNFTEAQFYAGLFASIGIIGGGFAAWLLAVKNSKYCGFDICYGSSTLFPWVLASQVISLGLAIFVFRYIGNFAQPGVTWVATFISVVGAPPAVMLLYGPSISALLTASVLGGLICAPTAIWIGGSIIPLLKIPGVVANVTAMAITGIIICVVCKMLPWVKQVPVKPHHSGTNQEPDVYRASWFVRRTLADFSEAQFYGNEVASIFMLVGVIIDWLICSTHGAYGSNAIPAIILSQFIGSAVGVFFYTEKFNHGGWYATYVPVVSVGPACVLLFGATVPVAVFAGFLGGILGGPIAEFCAAKLPEGVHGTVANVTSMAVCTTIVAIVMSALPWF
jgi:hypothetical protein